MFAGHFALAAGVKAKEPQVPLWSVMLATQLLDVVFVPLYLAGVETMDPVAAGSGYGDALIHANYSHSLVGALIISVIAGLLAGRAWGKRNGIIISAVAFSHWILDLLVHRPDLPILPGNVGHLPLLGFGLWKWPMVSAGLELLMIVVGGLMYFRYAKSRSQSLAWKPAPNLAKRRYLTAGWTMMALLVLSLVTDFTGIG